MRKNVYDPNVIKMYNKIMIITKNEYEQKYSFKNGR